MKDVRFNQRDLHRPMVIQLKPVVFNRTHDMTHVCGYESLFALRIVAVLVSAVMWKGLTQGLTPCLTDGTFSYPSCSAHTNIHTHAQTENSRILDILPFSWAAWWLKQSDSIIPLI